METILSFLRELAQHNNRDWFNENKIRYQESREIFREFIDEVLSGISIFDPALIGVEGKDSIFRIYKDIRFTKDKTPYKTNFGSWMARGGRKSNDAGYYFHLQPDASFMAAGVYMPPKENLHLIRQEIVFNPDGYREVFNDPWINEHYERSGEEDKLKKGPAGFPQDHEMIDAIKYRHYIFSKNYTNSEVAGRDFARKLAEDYRGLFPVVNYLNNALSFRGNE